MVPAHRWVVVAVVVGVRIYLAFGIGTSQDRIVKAKEPSVDCQDVGDALVRRFRGRQQFALV
jgi:hypothetical protein